MIDFILWTEYTKLYTTLVPISTQDHYLLQYNTTHIEINVLTSKMHRSNILSLKTYYSDVQACTNVSI